MVSTPQRSAHRGFIASLFTTLIAVPMLATVGGGPGWGMIGNDATNSRNQPLERRIGPDNVDRLAPKWVATTAGDVLGNTADLAAVLCDDERRAAGTRNALDDSLNLGRDGCAVPFHIRGDGIHGPLSDLPAIQVDA